MRLLLLALLVCSSLVLSPVSARAHPHAWIEMETALIFDDEGRASGLRISWLFDDFYSAFILEDMIKDGDGNFAQTALDALAQENLTSLVEYKYFTEVTHEGEKLSFAPVERYSTTVNDRRLWMDFDLPFEKPVDPKVGAVDYAVFDPTYYIEILHAEEGDPIRFEGKAPVGCSYALNPPTPPIELTMELAELDKTETPAYSAGSLFAERVVVTCP